MVASRTLTLFLLLSTLARAATIGNDDEEAAADRITSLPGYDHEELPSRHYSGYVRVGGGGGEGGASAPGGNEGGASAPGGARNLFYYMVESENDPARDPVVLWLNGGPGCSSFDAFVYEHGPFLFSPTQKDGAGDPLPTLTANPFRWSKVATIIYLDSPGNVGLSFVEDTDRFSANDTSTARDSDAFLRALLGERHPRLLSLPFFVTGESYAGIYVPTLARELVRGNAAGRRPRVNLAGYAVGNGCTDMAYDGDALPPFLAGRGLLPQDEFAALSAACNGSYWDAGGGAWGGSAAGEREGKAGECARLLDKSARVLKGINVYDVLDLCHASHRPSSRDDDDASMSLLRRPWAAATMGASTSSFSFAPDARVAALQPWARPPALSPPPPQSRPSVGGLLGHDPPCTSSSLADAWLNDDRVRAALHAPPVADSRGPGRWTLCSDRVSYTHDAGSMLPVHAELLPGLPGWPLMLARAGMHREAAAAAAASAASALGGGRDPAALRALVYSGDHDAAVPSTGSEAWTRDIGGGRAVSGRGWRRWEVEGGTDAGGRPADEGQAAGGVRRAAPRGGSRQWQQVAGFTVDYEGGLTYATIRGAGHMVPTSKPLEALEMFRRFVRGEDLAPAERDDDDDNGASATF